MARYIDAEALTAEFKRLTLGENSLIERIFADGVYNFPTADVVPKSEVEALKDDNKFLQDRRFKELSEVRQEVASKIFEEIEDVLNNIGYFDEIDFKALKKKYTESENKE